MLNVLLIILFGSYSTSNVVMEALLIAGLYRMFNKSGIAGWWAAVPCARYYMLARCAGKEEEGRVYSVLGFVTMLLSVGEYLAPTENLIIFFTIPTFALAIIRLIYMIRITGGLLEVYGRRRAWGWLWVLFPFIPALIWGFGKKYQPEWKVEDIRRVSRELISGHTVQGMSDGLTVNLEERTATEFFQKKYLLRDIHMYVRPGHMVLLLGGSGAGKTTFINAVNGYEKAKARVSLNGGDIYGDYKKMQYEVGFVPQQELMRGKDTVHHTLTDASKLRMPLNVSGEDRTARVEEVMDIFGLTPVKGNLVEKLSGGQKKRLSIAMEFLSNPSLFILDEPDSGLDGVMARELMEQLRKIADQGKIVIVITHTPDRVIDLFDDVIVLAKDSERTGRLAWFGPVEEARKFFGREKMEQIVMAVNRKEEGGEGRADEFIGRFAEVQHG